MKRRKITGLLLIFLVVCGFLLVLTAFLFNSQNNQDEDVLQSTVTLSEIEEETSLEIQNISLVEAKAALDSNSAVFVDVRDANSYAINHIPGALSIPLADLQNQLSELKSSDWIITYCT
jgi:3-mercaptopyruvate sulfurtransferase SseA